VFVACLGVDEKLVCTEVRQNFTVGDYYHRQPPIYNFYSCLFGKFEMRCSDHHMPLGVASDIWCSGNERDDEARGCSRRLQ
jgi:hypothetical protein